MIQIVICSPVPALRAGLQALISADPDLVVVAAVPGLDDLPVLDPEVRVIVATPGGLPSGGGGELQPDLALLLVSDEADETAQLAGLELRAWGVLSPEAPAEALQAAVRALAEGLVVVSPEMVVILREQHTSIISGEHDRTDELVESLTNRESEVLRALAQGLTNKQIALALHISEHTVKFHVSSIYSKLGAANRTEAVRKGARNGLLPL